MEFLQQAHSGWRWLVVAVVAIATLRYFIGFVGKQKFDKLSETLMTALNAVVGIQVLLGLSLFIWTWMVRDFVRQQAEHGFAMLVAVALLGALSSRWKKLNDLKRHRNYFILTLVVFALILVGMYALRRDPMALFR